MDLMKKDLSKVSLILGLHFPFIKTLKRQWSE